MADVAMEWLIDRRLIATLPLSTREDSPCDGKGGQNTNARWRGRRAVLALLGPHRLIAQATHPATATGWGRAIARTLDAA